MSALTPDCDPDMTHCGQPWQGKSRPGGGIVSAALLLAILGVSLVAVATHAVTDRFDYVAAPLVVLTAFLLVRRVVRLTVQGFSLLAARVPAVVVRREQPAG
jgi:hypothetical protein